MWRRRLRRFSCWLRRLDVRGGWLCWQYDWHAVSANLQGKYKHRRTIDVAVYNLAGGCKDLSSVD